MTRHRYQIVWNKDQTESAEVRKKALFAVGFDRVELLKGRGEHLGLISEPLAALLFRFASHLYTKIDKVVSKWEKEDGYDYVYDFERGRLGRVELYASADEANAGLNRYVEWADGGTSTFPPSSLSGTSYGYEVCGPAFPGSDFQAHGTETGRFSSDVRNESNTSKSEKEPYDHHIIHVEGGVEISVLSGFETCEDRDDMAKRLYTSKNDGVDNVFGLDIHQKTAVPAVFMYTNDYMEGGTAVDIKIAGGTSDAGLVDAVALGAATGTLQRLADTGPLTPDKIERWTTTECVDYIEKHELEDKLEVPTEDADLDSLRQVCVDHFKLTEQT